MEHSTLFRSVVAILCVCAVLNTYAQSISFVITNESCELGNDGAVNATVSGGQPPYQFSWNNGATTEDLLNVPAGTYVLTVTDDNNDQWFDFATVSEDVLVINTNNAWSFFYDGGAHLPCPYNCNGQIGIVTPLFTNATPPYQNIDLYDSDFNLFPWLGTTNDIYVFGGICANETLELYVVDANGCGAHTFIPVIGPDPISTPIFTPTAASNGLPNGAVDVDLGLSSGTFILQVINDQNNVVTMQNSSGGLHTFDDLYGGNYTLRVIYEATHDQCYEDHSFSIPDLSVSGLVEGTVFEDYNANCIQELGEPGIPNMVIEIDPGPHYAISNQNGIYQYVLPYGAYEISQTSTAVDQLCPLNDPENFTISMGTPAAQIDFADSSLTELDVELLQAHGLARPGFVFHQTLLIKNNSAESTGTITLTYIHDAFLQPDSSSQVYSVAGNELTWTLPAISGYQQTIVHVYLTVSSSVQLGTVLINSGSVSCAEPELPLANNIFDDPVVVTGAYDPNDKLSFPEGSFLLEQDSVIDYTIRFQNTGTDTAFNVVITDTLTADLDLSTLQIGAASHPFEYTLEAGRVLKFTFPNILLPDSNVNEPASHGYVGFRIRPIDGLQVGSMITNVANIYFDFNAPVITDPNILMIDAPTGIRVNSEDAILVFPNPTRGSVEISSNGALIERIEVHAMDGRMVLSKTIGSARTSLDLQPLSRGAYVIRSVTAEGKWQSHELILLP